MADMDRCIHDLDLVSCGFCTPPPTNGCRACGRPLDDALSQQIGIGPVCFRKHERYRSRVLKEIRFLFDDGHEVLEFGPLPESNAANWQQALADLSGFDAALRTRPNGKQYLYIQGMT